MSEDTVGLDKSIRNKIWRETNRQYLTEKRHACRNLSLERIILEIQKCEVVCCWCHVHRTISRGLS